MTIESKKKETPALDVDLAQVIGMGLIDVMRSRTTMQALEKAVDDFITAIPEAMRTLESKKKILDTVMNGRLAMESLYIRVSQSY